MDPDPVTLAEIDEKALVRLPGDFRQYQSGAGRKMLDGIESLHRGSRPRILMILPRGNSGGPDGKTNRSKTICIDKGAKKVYMLGIDRRKEATQ